MLPNRYSGMTFKKQLGYFNKTFLVGDYDYEGNGATFEVVHLGEVFKFESLRKAIEKFNEITGVSDDKG